MQSLKNKITDNFIFKIVLRIIQAILFISIIWYIGVKGIFGFMLGTILISYLILSNNPFFYMMINLIGGDKRDEISKKQTTRKGIEPTFRFKER